MREVIAFEAFDGTLFGSKNDCVEYERQNSTVYMWNNAGERTNFATDATFIWLSGAGAASVFLEQCWRDEAIEGDIEDGDEGLFMFDEWNDHYVYIPKDKLRGLTKVAEEIYE